MGFVTEEPIEYHPLFEAYNKDIGPAIRHLDEVRAVSPFFFELLFIVIGGLELNRALKGWTSPSASTIPDRIRSKKTTSLVTLVLIPLASSLKTPLNSPK